MRGIGRPANRPSFGYSLGIEQASVLTAGIALRTGLIVSASNSTIDEFGFQFIQFFEACSAWKFQLKIQ